MLHWDGSPESLFIDALECVPIDSLTITPRNVRGFDVTFDVIARDIDTGEYLPVSLSGIRIA